MPHLYEAAAILFALQRTDGNAVKRVAQSRWNKVGHALIECGS